MKGFVAVTDSGWYEHLRASSGPHDVNFWRPSAKTLRLEVGTPFLFKLKAPHHAIGGFGYFAGFSVVPDWLAWETFEEANGVDSFAELQSRLSRIRKGAGIERDPADRIGCCLIAEAVFFEPEHWIAPPNDWKRNVVVGASYDLSVGDGARMWAECLAQAPDLALRAPAVSERPEQKYGKPTTVVPRLGQSIFRIRVLDAYGRACAVTQEHSLPVLDAAHIVPYASGGQHEVSNGLLLRSDLHRLFDRGYVTVDKDMRFVVGDRLRDDFANGRSYYGLHGSRLAMPDDTRLIPNNDALEWHRSEAFLG